MSVVSDTSPLNYLILTGLDRILPALFARVAVPQAVFDELCSPGAPETVRAWLAAPPGWFEVRAVRPADPALALLDPGEREAITLAEELRAGLVLLDEARARRTATQRGLRVVGTLGLLDRAATRGLIDLGDALRRLSQTTFRASPKLLQSLKAGGPARPQGPTD
jgi:predicted nucleic acid-binding protein